MSSISSQRFNFCNSIDHINNYLSYSGDDNCADNEEGSNHEKYDEVGGTTNTDNNDNIDNNNNI